MKRFLIFVFALSTIALAQAPQSSDKTPGQSNPTGEPGSNLPHGATPAVPKAPPASAPATTTETTIKSTAPAKPGEVDPFLDVPPMPPGQVTLIGGTVRSIDRIRNRLTVEPFQAKTIKMIFDERSHIYRDGVETTMMGIHKGDRVYVDTQLDRTRVFARNIHVVTSTEAADARGQIVALHDRSITLQDELSSQPVTFRIDPSTTVKRRDAAGSQADLVPGSIVAVRFAPGKNRGMAKEVSVLAQPGNTFKFYGEITHLDLSHGLMAVHNRADDKTYELRFDPAGIAERNTLRVGTPVSIQAIFTGKDYRASEVTVMTAAQ